MRPTLDFLEGWVLSLSRPERVFGRARDVSDVGVVAAVRRMRLSLQRVRCARPLAPIGVTSERGFSHFCLVSVSVTHCVHRLVSRHHRLCTGKVGAPGEGGPLRGRPGADLYVVFGMSTASGARHEPVVFRSR